MTHEEKKTWMAVWAANNHCQLELEGECGFGRECVGVSANGNYPDYDDDIEFIPEDAYHKHQCVAVLGRGEPAESQLYEWLKWFDDNGYTVSTGINPNFASLHPIELLMGKQNISKIVKRSHP